MQETENNLTPVPKEKTKSKTKIDYSDPMVLLEIEGLARHGYDDRQIAEILDQVPETFCRHKKRKQPDGSPSQLSQSLTKGRRPLSVLVENSLYARAMGVKVKTTTKTTKYIKLPGISDEDAAIDAELVQETETITELPGDVNAIRMWLNAHVPDVYSPVVLSRTDLTSGGKTINQLPMITQIQHVDIPSSEVTKIDADT